MSVLRFETNIPITLALPVLQGLPIFKGRKREEMFVTVEGKRFSLPDEAAQRLRAIARVDEPFVACRRHGRFEFWLTNGSEQSRAAEEAPEVARQLRTSSNEVEPRGASEALHRSERGEDSAPGGPLAVSATPKTGGQPGETGPTVLPFPTQRVEREPLKPTGTDSLPVPALDGKPKLSLISSRSGPPGRVGYRAALADICKAVKSVLIETGLNLGDGPTQDLISTVFIAAQKERAVDFDFGDAA